MRRKRGEKRPPSSSLDGRRDGYWGDVELILRDAEGRGINLSGGSRAVAARLKQILVHGGLEALAIESWEAEELTRFVNDGLFREVYLRAVQHLGLATPPKPDAVQVEIEAVSEDAEEFDIIFRARLPAGRTVPTTEGDKPGPDCDLVMRLRVKRSEMIRTHPEFVVRDLSVEAHDPRVENPAPILEFDTEGHTSAAPLLTEQQIKAVADTNRVRLKDDFGGHVNQLARSLAERLRDRPDIPLLLTTGDVRREPISEEADWNEMLNHLGQWSPRRVSRLLNDRIFLDYYGHVVRRLGVDPPPDPRDVDVVLETRKNEYRAVDSYEVSFRARLPDSVIVRGKNGNFRGSQCDLTLNISTRYTESFDEDPQSEIGEPRIEVHGIEGGENDVPPPVATDELDTEPDRDPDTEAPDGLVRVEIPAPDDNGRVAVFNRVDFQRWQELLELCRTRLRADYLGLRTKALRNQDHTTAPSLASHLSERRAPRRLTTGVVPRGFIDETYDFKNALAEIAGPDDPSQLSRFLHDGMFRAAYEEFVEGLGLDPAIAPELVDIGVARDDNGAYTITFRAWLPSALRLRSGERELAGSQCNLALTIQVRAGGEINTEQPRFDFDLLIEVPEIAPRVTRTDEPQIDVEEVRNDPFEIRVRPQELAFPRNAPVGQNPDTGTHDGPIAPEQPPVEQVPEIDAPREIPEIELENLQIEVPGIARPSRCRTSKRPPETRSTPLWSWT